MMMVPADAPNDMFLKVKKDHGILLSHGECLEILRNIEHSRKFKTFGTLSGMIEDEIMCLLKKKGLK